ncbi:MAG: hypothetical protein ACI9K4_001490, partial [Polaribacter sp.]
HYKIKYALQHFLVTLLIKEIYNRTAIVVAFRHQNNP